MILWGMGGGTKKKKPIQIQGKCFKYLEKKISPILETH